MLNLFQRLSWISQRDLQDKFQASHKTFYPICSSSSLADEYVLMLASWRSDPPLPAPSPTAFALIFSGYHITPESSALTDKQTLLLADKLVHGISIASCW